MDLNKYRVEPGRPIRLDDWDTAEAEPGLDKKSGRQATKALAKQLADLGYRLYAENRRAVLLVLQGMDTAGKDGTIRSLMRGLNPQSCQVTSFKKPSDEEIDHDFLWRIHKAVPRRGNIMIFNRSHYEDVLVVRVANLVPESEWRTRYERINEFEQLLVDGGVTIIKCFLHISHDEQRARLQARLDNPDKRWKFSAGDLKVRLRWDDYQAAYRDALEKCSTPHAPWHVIPSDSKWMRNLTVARILVNTLESMAPQFPSPDPGLDEIVVS